MKLSQISPIALVLNAHHLVMHNDRYSPRMKGTTLFMYIVTCDSSSKCCSFICSKLSPANTYKDQAIRAAASAAVVTEDTVSPLIVKIVALWVIVMMPPAWISFLRSYLRSFWWPCFVLESCCILNTSKRPYTYFLECAPAASISPSKTTGLPSAIARLAFCTVHPRAEPCGVHSAAFVGGGGGGSEPAGGATPAPLSFPGDIPDMAPKVPKLT
mmetsp:Transcript_45124/g.103038  ORF Transcript_45124/g.103038 Transcript_45124/m.103038 type:complete len:214 (+) Transcript_45124:1087-1728(+)